MHRIGRTGRAGSSGEAVSLVCLDEEGFMQDIERFTKQQHPEKVIVPGFEAEAGERAEPWPWAARPSGAALGKPPSRDVMQAAAKAARTGDDAAHPRQQGRPACARRGRRQRWRR